MHCAQALREMVDYLKGKEKTEEISGASWQFISREMLVYKNHIERGWNEHYNNFLSRCNNLLVDYMGESEENNITSTFIDLFSACIRKDEGPNKIFLVKTYNALLSLGYLFNFLKQSNKLPRFPGWFLSSLVGFGNRCLHFAEPDPREEDWKEFAEEIYLKSCRFAFLALKHEKFETIKDALREFSVAITYTHKNPIPLTALKALSFSLADLTSKLLRIDEQYFDENLVELITNAFLKGLQSLKTKNYQDADRLYNKLDFVKTIFQRLMRTKGWIKVSPKVDELSRYVLGPNP